MLGSLTTTGSLIAAGKLQGVIRGTPVQFKGQQILNLLLFGGMVGCFVLHRCESHGFTFLLRDGGAWASSSA